MLTAIKYLTVLTLTCLTSSIAHAQTQQWHSSDSIGGIFRAYTMAFDGNGNVFAGAQGGNVASVFKYDSAGVHQWHNDYAGISTVMYADMVLDATGNSYYCGHFYAPTSYDAFIVKVNSAGTTVWSHDIDFSPGNYDDYTALTIDINGNILATGTTVSGSGQQLNVTKFTPDGTIVWAQHYSAAGYSYGADKITSDSAGNIFVGATRSGGSTSIDFVALKFDSTGTLLWEETANSGGDNEDSPYGMGVDHSGNIYLAGAADSVDEGLNFGFLAKFGYDGHLRWSREMARSPSNSLLACTLGNDGNLYVAGYDSGAGYVAKIDTLSGDTLWTLHYGSNISAIKFAHGALYATGNTTGIGTGSDYLTLKISTDGHILWNMSYNGFANGSDIASDIAIHNNDIVVGGSSQETSINSQVMTIVKYHETLSGIFESPANAPFTVSAYPNPADKELQFTIDMTTAGHATMYVYDLAGKQMATVFDQQMEAGKNTAVWNASSLAKGTYLYQMVTPSGRTTGKFVKY